MGTKGGEFLVLKQREMALKNFGPCPCGCGEPRRKYRLTATDECAGAFGEKEVMTAKPLATIELNHVFIDLWPDCVVTRSKEEGWEVVAAPNPGESIIQTAIHEALHSIIAEAMDNTVSVCLRGVALDLGKVKGGKFEEGLAFSMGTRTTQLVQAMSEAGYLKNTVATTDGATVMVKNERKK